MGKKLQKYDMSRIYKGFRVGKVPKYKLNLKALENCEVLTSLQHDMVKDTLSKCAYTKEVTVGDKVENKLIITVGEIYIARLFEQLEKPYNNAKVDHLGKPWEKSKMNVPQPVIGKKGKSRKDIKEEAK